MSMGKVRNRSEGARRFAPRRPKAEHPGGCDRRHRGDVLNRSSTLLHGSEPHELGFWVRAEAIAAGSTVPRESEGTRVRVMTPLGPAPPGDADTVVFEVGRDDMVTRFQDPLEAHVEASVQLIVNAQRRRSPLEKAIEKDPVSSRIFRRPCHFVPGAPRLAIDSRAKWSIGLGKPIPVWAKRLPHVQIMVILGMGQCPMYRHRVTWPVRAHRFP